MNVNLNVVRGENGEPIAAINKSKQEADVFYLSDDSGRTTVLWPRRPNCKQSFSDAQLVQGVKEDDHLALVQIVYDLEHDNPFIFEVIKNDTREGKKGKKSRSFLEGIIFPQLIPEKF